MQEVNYWIPAITSGGTVLASIITGFLAAAIKRRWDTKDDGKRWSRERDERRREEVRDALLAYIDARNAMENDVMRAFSRVSNGEPTGRADSMGAVMGLKRRLTRLQLLLDQKASAQFGTDYGTFIAWYDAPPVTATAPGGAVSVSTPTGIRDLARTTLKQVPLA